jgi:hypothetical protein
MSSNNPYGAQWANGSPQPPMPGQAQAPSRYTPGQPPPPYGYPPQAPDEYPDQTAVGSTETASGYTFGPFAPDPQHVGWSGGSERRYGGAAGRYSPGRAQPEPPRKGSGAHGNRKILIIVGAAGLAVILMAVIAVIVATRDPSANPQGSQGTAGQQGNSSQSGAARPSDAVAAYLQALAAGDAVTALSYAADPAHTGQLLTNEVLAASLERAPLTGIDVPVVEDQNAKSVSATYTLGSSVVSDSFHVVKVGDVWKISRAVKDLDISFLVDGSVPVKINGVKVTEDSVAVLPGSYAFTTGLRYVGFGSKNEVLVKSPNVDADTYQIQSQLTKAGKKAVISATEKSYNKCLQEHSLSPSNCPQKFKSKYTYNKSTITWQQAGGDPFRKPDVSFSGTQARVEVPINLKLSGSCTHEGRSGNCSGTLTGKSIAVVKVTSKPLKVRWL